MGIRLTPPPINKYPKENPEDNLYEELTILSKDEYPDEESIAITRAGLLATPSNNGFQNLFYTFYPDGNSEFIDNYIVPHLNSWPAATRLLPEKEILPILELAEKGNISAILATVGGIRITSNVKKEIIEKITKLIPQIEFISVHSHSNQLSNQENIENHNLNFLEFSPNISSLQISTNIHKNGYENTELNVEGLKHLQNLDSLEFSHSNVRSLDWLKEFPNLNTIRSLSINNSLVKTNLSGAEHLSNLEHLSVESIESQGDVEINLPPSLKYLEISNPRSYTYEQVRNLEGQTNLESLHINKFYFKKSDFNKHMPELPSLTTLTIGVSAWFQDAEKVIREKYPNLGTLNLVKEGHQTPAGFT